MKRVARWFKTRRQLLAELRNLERAVNDYQRAVNDCKHTLSDVDRVLGGLLEDYLERNDGE
ncbi:MAG: hypothetical protein QF878_09870 [SAR202 cluster bacterium]|nr:hypothetical protein [SAR202 cluster bacterium]